MPALIHKKTNQVLAEQILFSHSFFKRVRGLLGYKELKPHQVMWIKPCAAIHTFFMKFPIDVIFVDENLHVKNVCKNLAPWTILNSSGKIFSLFQFSFFQYYLQPSTYDLKNYFKNTSVFEFPSGALSKYTDINKGDQLHVDS